MPGVWMWSGSMEPTGTICSTSTTVTLPAGVMRPMASALFANPGALREIRTRPGDLFSKADIQRTIRELGQLGYFDPRSINIVPNPDPMTGSVDLEYSVTEQSTSQLELQGGWGANMVIGTAGLNFNNFSARNLFNKQAWRPLQSRPGPVTVFTSMNGTCTGGFCVRSA